VMLDDTQGMILKGAKMIQKSNNNRISLTDTINIMFLAMKFGLKNGFKQTVKFFIYDLANPIFYDFSPKFYVSKIVKQNKNFKDILKLSDYSKGRVYKLLNNGSMNVHEEHMTPNSQFQKKLIVCNNPNDFESFIRNNYAIAIITKEENNKLDINGFKINRTSIEDAFIAYKKMGVQCW